MKVRFWTDARTKVISEIARTLFSAFIVAGVIGGFMGKLNDPAERIWFALWIIAMLIISIVFADNPLKKEEQVHYLLQFSYKY